MFILLKEMNHVGIVNLKKNELLYFSGKSISDAADDGIDFSRNSKIWNGVFAFKFVDWFWNDHKVDWLWNTLLWNFRLTNKFINLKLTE